jgi:RND family efflux transporter MFP subunit
VTPQRQSAWFAGLILPLTVFVVGCSKEGPPAGGGEAPKVSVMHPRREKLTKTVEFNGWMRADKTQEVRSRVRGHIKAVHFTDGKLVKKGDLLFEIDPRPFQAELAAAKAQVKADDAELELAKSEVARIRPLVRTGAASAQEYDTWVAKQHVAEANKNKAQTHVDEANLQLEYSKITADQDGRIGAAQLTEGNLVNAGGSDPLLATIVSTDPIRVYFNVDERTLKKYADSAKAGGKNVTQILANLKDRQAPFTFALEGETDFRHKGTLAFSDKSIDPGTGTVQLYGVLDNKDGYYQAGQRVRVRLPLSDPFEGFLVPDTAILSDQDKRYVLIADDQNVVRRRDVTLGMLTDDGMREFKPAEEENPEDWWVIVDNLQRARLNYPVDPQKPAEKSGAK